MHVCASHIGWWTGCNCDAFTPFESVRRMPSWLLNPCRWTGAETGVFSKSNKNFFFESVSIWLKNGYIGHLSHFTSLFNCSRCWDIPKQFERLLFVLRLETVLVDNYNLRVCAEFSDTVIIFIFSYENHTFCCVVSQWGNISKRGWFHNFSKASQSCLWVPNQ